MRCEETMADAAAATHARNPRAKVFVYRNLVKALPWFATVRAKLDDPRYSGFFLKWGGELPSHVPRQGSAYYHDQLQTPQPNGTLDKDSLNAGNCTAGGCDCGANPCGEYLYDHRNGSMLRKFLVDEVIGGPTGIGHPAVSGVNVDDFWQFNGSICCGGGQGPSEEDPSAVADTGLSATDVETMHVEWMRTMKAVQAKLIASRAWQMEYFNCPQAVLSSSTEYCWNHDATERAPTASLATCNATCQAAQCTAYMRQHCKPNNLFQTLAWMMGFTVSAAGRTAVPDGAGGLRLPALLQDLARFLLLRGPFAWLGTGWVGCAGGIPGAGYEEARFVRPAELDRDYGVPTGHCGEVGESQVFERQYSKATVRLECRTWTGSVTMKSDDGPVPTGAAGVTPWPASASRPPAVLVGAPVLVGAHYFGGWYRCDGYPMATCGDEWTAKRCRWGAPADCISVADAPMFGGLSPTGVPTANFFAHDYPTRAPLLGNLTTVRARPGRLSALSVFHSKSVLYGDFVWARRALNRKKWRFRARAVGGNGPRGAQGGGSRAGLL
jgi:hypothetical protein